MTQQTDRNLLFGILALQMNFVTRDDLLKAMTAWLTRKRDSLATVMVEQGSLSVANEHLVIQVVDAQLALKNSDIRESLTSSIRMTDLAAALNALDDEEIKDSLADFSCDSDLGFDKTSTANRAVLDNRFVVVRPHASGGLGDVSVALDRELNREVALKRVRQQIANNPEACARFRMEAEVTGGLEHPGIVPVYSMGATEEGHPFYAMRFIRGETLHHAIRRYHAGADNDAAAGNLALRDLLRRFIDVGDAVSYAHSRGVLHRDLKPANIMLGSFGETLVVDWGLARVHGQTVETSDLKSVERPLQLSSGSASPETQHGRIMGTLQYMSPEQAEGNTSAVGPATDVYSLGTILYEILTGNPPLEKIMGGDGQIDVPKMLYKIQQGSIRPAKIVSPSVSVALSAICEKATALRVQDRYASVSELTKDIERWMADEPISIVHESGLQRAMRWARKHQTLAVSISAVLTATAIGLSIFGAIVSAKNGELNRLNASLDIANEDLQQSNEREHSARLDAETSELKARDQSWLAFSTFSSVLNDIEDGMKNVPGSGEVRRNLLKTALKKLDKVAA